MILPDTEIRFFPKRLVPFALEAGWRVHPESRQGDWAVLMTPARDRPKPVVIETRRLFKYAGAE